MADLPPKVKDHVEWLRKNLKDTILKYKEKSGDFKFAYDLIANRDLFPKEMDPSVSDWLDGDRVKIHCYVASFRDVLPILERIERLAEAPHYIHGFRFTESRDAPIWNERAYYCDRMTIEAELKGEGTENCKRVITGYTSPEPRPIYAFDCAPGQLQGTEHEATEQADTEGY